MRRLLVSDYVEPRLHLVDMERGSVLQSFTTAGVVSGLYHSETRRFGFAMQGSAGRMDIIDGVSGRRITATTEISSTRHRSA